MNKPLSKKALIIIAAIEVAVIIFCLVVSIWVMVTIDPNANHQKNIDLNGPFIGTLQNNSILFALTIVLPLFLIFVVDGVYLIMYATKRESMLSDQEKNDLLEEAKRQASPAQKSAILRILFIQTYHSKSSSPPCWRHNNRA